MFVDRDLRKVFVSLEDAITEYNRTKSIASPSHEVLIRPSKILCAEISSFATLHKCRWMLNPSKICRLKMHPVKLRCVCDEIKQFYHSIVHRHAESFRVVP